MPMWYLTKCYNNTVKEGWCRVLADVGRVGVLLEHALVLRVLCRTAAVLHLGVIQLRQHVL